MAQPSPTHAPGKMLLLGFLAAVAVLGAGGALWFILSRASGVDVFIDFQDARGLEAGDKVVLNGMEVGRVQQVKLGAGNQGVEVAARLQSETASRVPSDARATIHGQGWTNLFSGKVLEILLPEQPTAPPVHSGSRLKGLDGDLAVGAWHLGEALHKTSEAIGKQVEQIGAALEDVTADLQRAVDSPETRKLQDDLNGLMKKLQDGGDQAAQRIEQAQRDWPTVRARMEAEKERLQREGKQELADKLDKAEKQINETVEKAKDNLPQK